MPDKLIRSLIRTIAKYRIDSARYSLGRAVVDLIFVHFGLILGTLDVRKTRRFRLVFVPG